MYKYCIPPINFQNFKIFINNSLPLLIKTIKNSKEQAQKIFNRVLNNNSKKESTYSTWQKNHPSSSTCLSVLVNSVFTSSQKKRILILQFFSLSLSQAQTRDTCASLTRRLQSRCCKNVATHGFRLHSSVRGEVPRLISPLGYFRRVTSRELVCLAHGQLFRRTINHIHTHATQLASQWNYNTRDEG